MGLGSERNGKLRLFSPARFGLAMQWKREYNKTREGFSAGAQLRFLRRECCVNKAETSGVT